MIDTVIFDLDGTLLDTLDDLRDSVNYALGRLGHPQRTRDEIRHFVGNGIPVLLRLALPEGSDTAEYEKCHEIFTPYYLANMQNKTVPYIGVDEMLAQVKSAGYKTAVVTNKDEAAAKELCRELFGDKIDLTVGTVAQRQRKPAPDGVNFALRQLGSGKETAVYIGDSEVDAQTARNAGLPCIGALWGFRDKGTLEKEGIELLAATPVEILELIKKI